MQGIYCASKRTYNLILLISIQICEPQLDAIRSRGENCIEVEYGHLNYVSLFNNTYN